MNIRKLAALDMALHGRRVIVAEFGFGVAGPLALGLLSLARGRTAWQEILGWYLIALALNYVPLLVYALAIGSRENATQEAEQELRHGSARKYGVLSLILLLPLVIPAMALLQIRKRH